MKLELAPIVIKIMIKVFSRNLTNLWQHIFSASDPKNLHITIFIIVALNLTNSAYFDFWKSVSMFKMSDPKNLIYMNLGIFRFWGLLFWNLLPNLWNSISLDLSSQTVKFAILNFENLTTCFLDQWPHKNLVKIYTNFHQNCVTSVRHIENLIRDSWPVIPKNLPGISIKKSYLTNV